MDRLEIQNELLFALGRVADAHDVETYVVGGFVRDQLMGRPTTDIDLVVAGDGIAYANWIAHELRGSKPVIFEKFRTARVRVGDVEIEIVGARSEAYTADSRKPLVRAGTLHDDLQRRDFTVNAIAVSINAERYGEMHDPFHGAHDIEKRILRTPLDPKATFSDDPLRMMRACRFTAQLHFRLDEKVRQAILSMHERLSIVSIERIRDEFQKIMNSPQPSVGLALLLELGLLRHFFPELHALAGVDQRSVEYPDGVRNFHHKDVFYHTLRVVDNVARVSADIWLRWGALLHDIAKPQTKAFTEAHGWSFHGHAEIGARHVRRIFKNLRLPFEAIPFVAKLVALHLRPMALVDEGVTDSAIRRLLFEAGDDIDALVTLCRADITSKNPKLVRKYLQNYEYLVSKMREVEEKDRLRQWQPPLSGEDIMALCSIPSGITVGLLKTRIEDAVLDGVIENSREAAIAFLLSIRDEVLAAPAKGKPRSRKSMLQQLPEGLKK